MAEEGVEEPIPTQILRQLLEEIEGSSEFDSACIERLRGLIEAGGMIHPDDVIEALRS